MVSYYSEPEEVSFLQQYFTAYLAIVIFGAICCICNKTVPSTKSCQPDFSSAPEYQSMKKEVEQLKLDREGYRKQNIALAKNGRQAHSTTNGNDSRDLSHQPVHLELIAQLQEDKRKLTSELELKIQALKVKEEELNEVRIDRQNEEYQYAKFAEAEKAYTTKLEQKISLMSSGTVLTKLQGEIDQLMADLQTKTVELTNSKEDLEKASTLASLNCSETAKLNAEITNLTQQINNLSGQIDKHVCKVIEQPEPTQEIEALKAQTDCLKRTVLAHQECLDAATEFYCGTGVMHANFTADTPDLKNILQHLPRIWMLSEESNDLRGQISELSPRIEEMKIEKKQLNALLIAATERLSTLDNAARTAYKDLRLTAEMPTKDVVETFIIDVGQVVKTLRQPKQRMETENSQRPQPQKPPSVVFGSKPAQHFEFNATTTMMDANSSGSNSALPAGNLSKLNDASFSSSITPATHHTGTIFQQPFGEPSAQPEILPPVVPTPAEIVREKKEKICFDFLKIRAEQFRKMQLYGVEVQRLLRKYGEDEPESWKHMGRTDFINTNNLRGTDLESAFHTSHELTKELGERYQTLITHTSEKLIKRMKVLDEDDINSKWSRWLELNRQVKKSSENNSAEWTKRCFEAEFPQKRDNKGPNTTKRPLGNGIGKRP